MYVMLSFKFLLLLLMGCFCCCAAGFLLRFGGQHNFDDETGFGALYSVVLLAPVLLCSTLSVCDTLVLGLFPSAKEEGERAAAVEEDGSCCRESQR
jgi:hypothetical protein